MNNDREEKPQLPEIPASPADEGPAELPFETTAPTVAKAMAPSSATSRPSSPTGASLAQPEPSKTIAAMPPTPGAKPQPNTGKAGTPKAEAKASPKHNLAAVPSQPAGPVEEPGKPSKTNIAPPRRELAIRKLKLDQEPDEAGGEDDDDGAFVTEFKPLPSPPRRGLPRAHRKARMGGHP